MTFEEWVDKLTDPIKKQAGLAVIDHNKKWIGGAGKAVIDILDINTPNDIKQMPLYHFTVEEYEEEMYQNGKQIASYPLGPYKGRWTFNTKNWSR